MVPPKVNSIAICVGSRSIEGLEDSFLDSGSDVSLCRDDYRNPVAVELPCALSLK